MTNKKTLLVSVLLMSVCLLFAETSFVKSELFPTEQSFEYTSQVSVSGGGTNIPANAALLAVGTPDYPVRPGDIYQLSYYDGAKIIIEEIQIDSNYNASISNIGSMNAKGLTYLDFKDKVEKQVRTFYSYAKPNLTLKSCGVYSVNIAGEVTNSSAVTVWGLTRLSDLAGWATQYASTRDVRVTFEDGNTFTYDLYAASRLGQTIQNPYLEPGCTVTFMKAKITVSISGAVQRPGVYQPLESDTLASLIETYSNGLTNKADSTCYYISRYVDGKLEMYNIAAEKAAEFALQFGDAIYVAEKVNELKTVLVQGAVEGGKTYYQFYEGETVEYMARSLAKQLEKDSDIKNIIVTRNGQILSPSETLMEGDIVSVPFLEQYVTVSGAVRTPGKYIYTPGKDVDYYIARAGGYAENARKTSVKIYDENGETAKTLQPNSIINVSYKTTEVASTIALASAIASLTLQIFDIVAHVSQIGK